MKSITLTYHSNIGFPRLITFVPLNFKTDNLVLVHDEGNPTRIRTLRLDRMFPAPSARAEPAHDAGGRKAIPVSDLLSGSTWTLDPSIRSPLIVITSTPPPPHPPRTLRRGPAPMRG